MVIQKIKIENFKSIYEPIEFDFNDIQGFWKISGSVGAGKTTIGEAIIYGLFGSINGKNQSDLISWGRKHGLIEIWCVSKGRSIYIKRELNSYGQSPIYVEIDGEELIFTNKRDAQIQLEQEYYDTSRVTIELLCIISFNNFKSLATLNTQDTRKFLDQILGFHVLNEYTDICKEFKTSNSITLTSIRLDIAKIKSQVSKLQEIANLEVIEGDKIKIQEEINLCEKQLSEIELKHKQWFDEKIATKNQLVSKQGSILTLGKNKKKEIDFIKKGTCPTCGAPIDQSHLEQKIKERELLLEQYSEVGKQIDAIVDEMDKEVARTHREDVTPIKQKISDLRTLITRLDEQSKRLEINQDQINKLLNNIESQEKLKLHHEKEEQEWSQLYNILSTQVRGKILQSFIPSLNKNILKYVQRLHLPYIVEFNNEFKCCIHLCGFDQEIPISSLSTGQLKTVDMVIILGVLGTIIGSNGINVLFLDELFSNLDAGLRNEMCKVLRETVTPGSTIFIISHTDLEDRYFDGNIHMKLEIREQYEKHSISSIEKIETV